MPIPIIIWFHAVFHFGEPPEPRPNAVKIVVEQMTAISQSGLLHACSEMHVGINGPAEAREIARLVIPSKAQVIFHGPAPKNELRTLLAIERWVKSHPGEAYVLYAHSKGASHPPEDPLSTPWRACMTRHCIHNWRKCVAALDEGCDVAGCHWLVPPVTPPTQYIFGGNVWWSKASFLATLPSLMLRDRIKDSGIDAIESRFEAEIILGQGPRLPLVKDFHPNWNPSHTACPV